MSSHQDPGQRRDGDRADPRVRYPDDGYDAHHYTCLPVLGPRAEFGWAVVYASQPDLKSIMIIDTQTRRDSSEARDRRKAF